MKEQILLNIKDITEESFQLLKHRWLPTLPAGFSSIEAKTPQDLIDWRDKFISLYGTEGKLNTKFNMYGTVTENENFRKNIKAAHKEVNDFYKRHKIHYDG